MKSLPTARRCLFACGLSLGLAFAGLAADPASSTKPPQAAAAAPDKAGSGAARDSEEAPLSFRIGQADFTPGGFLDFAHAYRSTNVGSGVPTAFGAIPYPDTTAGKMSESRFGVQASRISLKITSRQGSANVTGYVEADFTGNNAESVYVTSNSATFRLRQYWIDVQRGRWEFLGGQAWTLLSPNLSGLSSNPIGAIFLGQGVDTNYIPGLVWTRPALARVIFRPTKKFLAAFGVENAEQYTGAAVVLPAFAVGQVDNGANSKTPNVRPDFTAKIAYEGKVAGRFYHFEAGGLLRSFLVIRPDGSKSTARGTGATVNGNFEIVKNLRLIFTTYYSNGGGRYLTGMAPDMIVRPNGDLAVIKAASGIGGFEYQLIPQSMIYGYYSSLYAGRSAALDGTGKYVGYGFPGSSTAANRQIRQFTFGYTHTFWKSPSKGSLQLLSQYAYVERAPWSPAAAGPRSAHTHMVMNSLRYFLP